MSPETGNPENDEVSHFTALCHKAEESALKLIARAEQNSFGLAAKLEKKGFQPAVIKTVISGLLDRDLLNDERYASLWLRSRLKKKAQSPKTLLTSLRKRGIDRHSSKKALEEILDADTEYALLLKYIEAPENSKLAGKGDKFYRLRLQLKYERFSVESIDRYFDAF